MSQAERIIITNKVESSRPTREPSRLSPAEMGSIEMQEGAMRCSNAGVTWRRGYVGGSDARIIMGTDETALLRTCPAI
jgi:hypothetical protein